VGRVDAHLTTADTTVGPGSLTAGALVDDPVDRLDGLALRDGVVPGPAPAVAEALELHLPDQALAEHDGVGEAVRHGGHVDPRPPDGALAATHDAAAEAGVHGAAMLKTGGVARVSHDGRGHPRPALPECPRNAIAIDVKGIDARVARP